MTANEAQLYTQKLSGVQMYMDEEGRLMQFVSKIAVYDERTAALLRGKKWAIDEMAFESYKCFGIYLEGSDIKSVKQYSIIDFLKSIFGTEVKSQITICQAP